MSLLHRIRPSLQQYLPPYSDGDVASTLAPDPRILPNPWFGLCIRILQLALISGSLIPKPSPSKPCCRNTTARICPTNCALSLASALARILAPSFSTRVYNIICCHSCAFTNFYPTTRHLRNLAFPAVAQTKDSRTPPLLEHNSDSATVNQIRHISPAYLPPPGLHH